MYSQYNCTDLSSDETNTVYPYICPLRSPVPPTVSPIFTYEHKSPYILTSIMAQHCHFHSDQASTRSSTVG